MPIDRCPDSGVAGAGRLALPTGCLTVVAYHYVRDLSRTRFPAIKALQTDRFASQVKWLLERYEMATLESALEFLDGRYRPKRELCLLTFDDGLREHYTDVTPILAEHRIQGLFFLTTACMDGWVAPVHKNHFLMAALPFEQYRGAIVERLHDRFPTLATTVDGDLAQRTHRFDSADVAEFKYLLNYQLSVEVRNELLDELFVETFGDEGVFARELYLEWSEAIQMQVDGMSLGGHSHQHRALSTLEHNARWADLQTCASQLHQHLRPQAAWPFSYPHGDTDAETKQMLEALGFCCAFTVRIGPRQTEHSDRFAIQRIDATEVGA